MMRMESQVLTMRTWSQVAFCDCGKLVVWGDVSNPPPGAPAPLFSDAPAPLTWSAASFVRLAGDIAADKNVVLPQSTLSRYVAHAQGTTTLTVSSPDDGASVLALSLDPAHSLTDVLGCSGAVPRLEILELDAKAGNLQFSEFPNSSRYISPDFLQYL